MPIPDKTKSFLFKNFFRINDCMSLIIINTIKAKIKKMKQTLKKSEFKKKKIKVMPSQCLALISKK